MGLEEVIERFRQRGLKCERKPDGHYDCQCPAHPGEPGKTKDLNLKISQAPDGKLLVRCHSHKCGYEAIMGAVGLQPKDGFPAKPNGSSLGQPEATYPYRDEKGNVLFYAGRFPDKEFKQFRVDARGERIWSLGGVRRVLFGLPELLATTAREWVCIVEGEKDALNVAGLGLAATTNPMGARKWRQEYTTWLQEHLADRRFVILPDNDEEGTKHAEEVRASLTGAGLEVRVLVLPDLPPKGDVSDWIERGGTGEALRAMLRPRMAARVLSGKALLALELPAAPWIVPGVVCRRMVQLFAGREKTGKSVLVETLCLAAAAGGMWIGEECEPTKTLFLNWEDPLQVTKGRLLKHLAPGEEPPDDYFVHPPPYTISIWDLLDDLKQLIEEEQYGLVIIDPIARAAKWKDENDASETAVVFEALQEIADATGCGFVPVHHANKSEGQFGDVIRGSTAIPAGVIGFSILRRTKNRREFAFETVHKMAAEEDTIRILGRDRETMTWQLLRKEGPTGDDDESEGEQHRNDILDLIRVEAGITQEKLQMLTGLHQSTVSRHLGRLRSARLVTRQKRMELRGEEGDGRPPWGYWPLEG